MGAAASYLQDVQAHREACAFLRVFVCFCASVTSVSQSVCLWMLPASACVQVLLGRHALHAYERAHEGVFCVHGRDYRSKSACYSWAGATAFLRSPWPQSICGQKDALRQMI